MAAIYTLQIKQGETLYHTFRWNQGDGVTPVNLTGYTGRCQIRNGAYNQGIVKNVPVLIIDATAGRFALSLTATETRDIPTTGYDYSNAEQYAYDVEFTSADGTVYRVMNGIIKISPEVTR
jgi:hypothetical protein